MSDVTSRAADLILEQLDRSPDGCTARQLAMAVGRHEGNVRRVLGELQGQGLVCRHSFENHLGVWTRTGAPAPQQPETPGRRQELTTAVPPQWVPVLNALAEEKNVSRSALLAELLERGLQSIGVEVAA